MKSKVGASLRDDKSATDVEEKKALISASEGAEAEEEAAPPDLHEVTESARACGYYSSLWVHELSPSESFGCTLLALQFGLCQLPLHELCSACY